jgi:nitrate reductase delta subunit
MSRNETPRLTFKVLGLLLDYPSRELIDGLGELNAVLEGEGLLDGETRAPLAALMQDLASRPLLDLQEEYVALFDMTGSLSLNLFEHVHGESKMRGQAMADLQAIYREYGLTSAKQLPDYLPLLCEFLSVLPPAEAVAVLCETAPAIELLRARLEKRGSAHAAVIACLSQLSGSPCEAGVTDIGPVQPASFSDLDRGWEEALVEFGVADAFDSCESPIPGRSSTP